MDAYSTKKISLHKKGDIVLFRRKKEISASDGRRHEREKKETINPCRPH